MEGIAKSVSKVGDFPCIKSTVAIFDELSELRLFDQNIEFSFFKVWPKTNSIGLSVLPKFWNWNQKRDWKQNQFNSYINL